MNLNGTHLKVVQGSEREISGGKAIYKALARDNPDVNLADLFGVVVEINGVPRRVKNVEFYGGLGDDGPPSEVWLTVEWVYG